MAQINDHIVLLTFDDNYVDQSINLILSILKQHPAGVSFVCLCPTLSPANAETLMSVVRPLRLICYNHTPIIPTTNWPACTMFRLFAPWLLDSEIHKVVYLDSDMLCTGSLQALFDADPVCLAMCNEIAGNIFAEQQQCITAYLPYEIYCNAGMCVMNLDSFRSLYSFDSFVELLLQHQKDLHFPDQDFLNFFLRDNTVILNGFSYNFQPYEFKGSRYYKQALANCKLIHFSFMKPWFYKTDLYLIQLYLRYSDYPPMIRKTKTARRKSMLHSVVRFTRPVRSWLFDR